MVSININFDNSNEFFFEGEKLSLNVDVNVDDTVKISELTANLTGVSRCILEKSVENSNSVFYFVHHPKNVTEKVHFDDVVPLFQVNETEKNYLTSENRQFRLSYQLPAELPSSLEYSHAHVRYAVHVSAVTGEEIINKTKYFSVVSKLDLNNYESYKSFLSVFINERIRNISGNLFTFSCCGGHINASLQLDKGSYVPGESIIMNAEINNNANTDIHWVQASLVQILKYHSSKMIKRKRVVADVQRGMIAPHKNQTWKGEKMMIPAVPPTTNLTSQNLIGVKYKMYLQIKVFADKKAFTGKEKVLIGSLPFRDVPKKGQGDDSALNNADFTDLNLESCYFTASNKNSSNFKFCPVYPIYLEYE